jgi:hypothetical protein
MSHVRTPEDDDGKIGIAIQGEMEELQALLRDIPLEPPPKIQSLNAMTPDGDTSSVMITTNNNNTSSNHTSSSSRNDGGGTRKRTKISPYNCCCG